jgi:hypothetical protein
VAELANIVAELRSSGLRWHTLQAVGREWRHHALLNEAFIAATLPPPAGARAGVHFQGGGTIVRTASEPAPEVGEEIWRWWSQEPDRLKVEFAVGNETVTAWFQGSTWWSWSPSQGARTNEGRENVGHGKGPGEALVSRP